VVQDIRGKYGSEGDYVMNRPTTRTANPTPVDDATDTYDTIDWLVKNVPESNGKVGTIGISYDGFESLMALLNPHPALKVSVPMNPMVDGWMGDDWFHNGAFPSTKSAVHLRTRGHPRQQYQVVDQRARRLRPLFARRPRPGSWPRAMACSRSVSGTKWPRTRLTTASGAIRQWDKNTRRAAAQCAVMLVHSLWDAGGQLWRPRGLFRHKTQKNVATTR